MHQKYFFGGNPTMKRIIAIVLCLMMVLSFVACDKGSDATTTEAPKGTNAPADTTKAPEADTTAAPADETTAAPAPETTAAPETTEAPVLADPIEFDQLSAAEQAALKACMPTSLPDLSSYEIVTRAMCFDRGEEDYFIEGNSAGSAQFVDVTGGAIFGKAIKVAAINDKGDNRAEIQVLPFGDMDISTAKGVIS